MTVTEGGRGRSAPAQALDMMLEMEQLILREIPNTAHRQFYELLSFYRQRGLYHQTAKQLVLAINVGRGRWFVETMYAADLEEMAQLAMQHFDQIDIPAPSLHRTLMEDQ